MAVTDTLINTLFDGRYRIIRKLGSGGMANVYLAEDEELGRRVAIKLLNDRYANDELFIERFRREAKSAAGLSHPNIVSIYDRGEAEGTYYIAMEVIEGRSLKELILTRGPLPITAALTFAREILDALRFAHRHGIIHRDIKPHNILIGERLKVTDFGIARAGTSQMTEAGSIMGTAQYLSPEQARGAPVTAASDLYSVGIVLYEMLTGKVPFTGDSPIEIAMKHLNDPPKPPSRIRPEIPEELDQVVLRALAKQPEQRYQTAEEFSEDLTRVEAGLPVAPETAEAATAVITGATALQTGATEVLGPEDATRVTSPRPYTTRRPPPTYPPSYGYEEPARKGSRAGPWLLVLLLLAAAALAGWYVFTQIEEQLGSATAAVPLVEGLKEGPAVAQIEAAGLEANVIRAASSEDPPVPVGTVGDQDPEAGVRISEGDTVTLYVSTGPPKTVVPNVVGLTFEEAIEELDGADLEWRRREVFSRRPDGEVVKQNPAADEEVVVGTTVVLNVSKGRQMVEVPNVLDQSEDSARAELREVGFQAEVVFAPSSEIEEGNVALQDPGPGEEAPRGSTVTLTVSTGPATVTVPNVVQQGREQAEQTLGEAGFEVNVQTQPVADPTQENVVLDQDPDGGSEAQGGSTVTIVVGDFPG
jgi:beta-lactam-binding protein with PASTA domain/tRNA A-37 threonylcarbamoyl transferase component Bud32